MGIAQDGKIVAGVLFEDYNGASLAMHCAGEPRSLFRRFLWMVFDYPFAQLKCKKVYGPVPASNIGACRLNEHLGFKVETRLVDAHPEGDILLFAMRKEDCRWLVLGERYRGKAVSTASA